MGFDLIRSERFLDPVYLNLMYGRFERYFGSLWTGPLYIAPCFFFSAPDGTVLKSTNQVSRRVCVRFGLADLHPGGT